MTYFSRQYRRAGLRAGLNAGLKAGVVTLAAGMLVAGCSGAGAQGLQVSDAWQKISLVLMHSKAPGYLGVEVTDLDTERVQALKLKDGRGAEITVLDHDAPAYKVGLKLHDVMLEINGEAIENSDHVKRLLKDTAPGHRLEIVYWRDGAQQTVKVDLADRKKMEEEAWAQLGDSTGSGSGAGGQAFMAGSDQGSGQASGAPGVFSPWSRGGTLNVGAMVEPLAPQTADILGVDSGVVIKSVAHKSAADLSGLKARDVILQVGAEAVVTKSDWERLLRSGDGKSVQVTILRDRVRQTVTLTLDVKHRKAVVDHAAGTSDPV